MHVNLLYHIVQTTATEGPSKPCLARTMRAMWKILWLILFLVYNLFFSCFTIYLKYNNIILEHNPFLILLLELNVIMP